MTVRCPSNGRSASSTSGLVAPAAQSSTGRAACSCLPWSVVVLRRPHRPYYSHRWPGHPSTHPHPLLFYGADSVTLQPNQWTLVLLSAWEPTAASSPAQRRPFLGLAVVHRLGALGAGWSMWSTTDFHRKSTVRGEADSWVQAAARKCLLITCKIIIPPPDSRDPPDGPPYFVKNTFPP